MSVSVVLPCYNPPPGWANNIIHQYSILCDLVGQRMELIIVQDGAGKGVTDTDLTSLRNNIHDLQIIFYDTNRGKGHALRKGIEQASGDIIIYTDIDFPYSNESFDKIYTALQNDTCDIAVGVKDASYYQKVPFIRRVISKYLQFFIRTFLSIPITDTQCGLKGFKVAVSPIFLATTIDRYLFDLEFIRNCYKSKKYRIMAIPITLNPGIHFRPMSYKILLPEIFNFISIFFR